MGGYLFLCLWVFPILWAVEYDTEFIILTLKALRLSVTGDLNADLFVLESFDLERADLCQP